VSADSRRSHVVFVHGAWHDPAQWDLVRKQLSGTQTSAVGLVSTGSDPAVLGDMYADADGVRAHLDRVRRLEPSAYITVVAHSYGGIPVVQGLSPDDGENPLADHLVFLGAFMLDVGESLMAAAGAVVPEWWLVDEQRDIVDPGDPLTHFYSDMPSAEGRQAAARLRHQRWSSFRQPLTSAAWRDIRSTYVVLEKDGAIPPFAQEAMAARASRVLHLQTSHTPFLSRPAETAMLLQDMLSAATS
jgi:pimeloyl-ACP methyl ester carboxylesterase